MLYDNVINVARLYMGPAAEAFVKRQIKSHLKIEPEMLNNQHIDELARGCQISARLIMDKEKAQEFGNRIKNLA